MAGLLDFLDDAGDVAANVGKGTLGLLGGIGEAYLAAKAPAMYKSMTADRNYQRDQQARQQWVNNMPMAQGQQNLAPDAFSMNEASVMQGMDPTDQVYQGATQPSWQDMAKYYGKSPDEIGRTAGAKLTTDHFAPKAAAKHQFLNTGNAAGTGRQQNIVDPITGKLTPVGPSWENTSAVQVNTGDKSKPKPGPVTGMVSVEDPETGEWRLEIVPGGPMDLDGPQNIRLESKEYAKEFTPIRRINSGVKRLRDTVNEYGVTPMPGQLGNSLAAQSTDIILTLKEYYNLGVLSGTDEELMRKITSDPNSLKAAFLGKDAYLAQLDELDGIMRRAESSLDEQYSHSKQSKKHRSDIEKQKLNPIHPDLTDAEYAELLVLRKRFPQ